MLNDTPKRYGNTAKKLITLTHDGRERLQQFADENDMSFSAAIETLALIGLDADLATLLVPLLNEAVKAGLKQHLGRMARLSATAAAEAAMAHHLSTMLLLQVIRQEAANHPQDFETRLSVAYEPEEGLDFRIREIYNQMCRLARTRQKRLMRQPLAELLAEYGPEMEEENE